MPGKIEISHKTILFTVFLLILLWLLVQIQEIIFAIFVAFIFMSAINPWADFLERYRIPRAISVLSIYIFLIGLVAFAANSILPPLVVQTIRLGENLPVYIRSVVPFITFDIKTLTQQITPVGENILKVTVGLFSNIIALFTLFVISFYLILERKNLKTHLAIFMGDEGAQKVMKVVSKVEERLGAWVRGQAALALVIGVSTYFGLSLLGIPYTFPLAILAGLLEIVPIIGPIISAIPAIIVAVTISPFLALATAAMYFIIQQLEANLVVPFVMRKAVGLPPLVTIIALMVGAKLGGINGAILAIPVFVTIETIFREYLHMKETVD